MTTPRPGDSFGTFLRVLHGEQPSRDDRDETALNVVRILSEGGPAGLADLRKAAGANPALFWPALQNLMEAKLVQDIGTVDAELLALTEVGVTVASLARRDSL